MVAKRPYGGFFLTKILDKNVVIFFIVKYEFNKVLPNLGFCRGFAKFEFSQCLAKILV
jgi:hypothetical protein